MANQKQRRRRAKEKRHQYDLVEIDGEGNETVLSATDVKSEAPERQAKRPASRASKTSSGRGAPKPPTWGRVLKRAAIFVPFSYFMDRLLWRSHEKRLAKTSTR